MTESGKPEAGEVKRLDHSTAWGMAIKLKDTEHFEILNRYIAQSEATERALTATEADVEEWKTLAGRRGVECAAVRSEHHRLIDASNANGALARSRYEALQQASLLASQQRERAERAEGKLAELIALWTKEGADLKIRVYNTELRAEVAEEARDASQAALVVALREKREAEAGNWKAECEALRVTELAHWVEKERADLRSELGDMEHLLEVERRYHEETKGYRQHAEQQLTSERAGRERLELSRQATLDILAEEYPKLGAQWRGCLAFVFGALGEAALHDQLQAATPAPPSEGPASPVAEGERVE